MRSAARPWWVGMTCLKPVRSRTTSRKRTNERLPAYDSSPCDQRAPLGSRHRTGAGVGEEVDHDVGGADQEEVVAGLAQRALAVVAGGELDVLDRLDAKRLDDGTELHAVPSIEARRVAQAGVAAVHFWMKKMITSLQLVGSWLLHVT